MQIDRKIEFLAQRAQPSDIQLLKEIALEQLRRVRVLSGQVKEQTHE